MGYIKLGKKGKHIEVPEGYIIATDLDEKVNENMKILEIRSGFFGSPDSDDIEDGIPVGVFGCVIKKSYRADETNKPGVCLKWVYKHEDLKTI